MCDRLSSPSPAKAERPAERYLSGGVSPYLRYRRIASKLKLCASIISFVSVIPNSYADFTLHHIGQVYRLKGPSDPSPQVKVDSTRSQGGDCKGDRTLDLVLTFEKEPKSWLENQSRTTGGPCQVSARPLDDGGFEIRLSYRATAKSGLALEFLPFISTQRFVVDHWLSTPRQRADRRPKKTAPTPLPQLQLKTIDEVPSAKIEASTLGRAFEDQSSWEKILGSAAVALDFNSPELDRFRDKKHERDIGISPETVERQPLHLPILDLPALESPLSFAEQKIEFPPFVIEGSTDTSTEKGRARKSVQDGMNFVVLLTKRGDWMKARESIDILERSKRAELIPRRTPEWQALKGLVYLNLGRQVGETMLEKKGLQTWTDALRSSEAWVGGSQEFVEFMALESVRYLFGHDLVYGAASLLSWARRYSWTAATEERFGFLRGEAFYQLDLYEEARDVFSDFVESRRDIPVSSFADRRLVSAAAYRLGDLEFRAGRYKEAVDRYTQAFVEGPRVRKFSFEGTWYPEDVRIFPYVLYNRAEALNRLGREEGALRDLRAFLFVAPSHPDSGLVYYRIGDVLSRLHADGEKATGAWRECLFKVPKTLGGRLCGARKAAQEISEVPKNRWARLIAEIEDASLRVEDPHFGERWKAEVNAYLQILVASAFLEADQPYQAVLRLDPLEKLPMSEYLRIWWREYFVTALAGWGEKAVAEGKGRKVIRDYEDRQKDLFLKQSRHEVLWNVVQAYKSLGLLDEALEALETGEKVRDRIDRKELRPYEHSNEEWAALRASIEIELVAQKKKDIDPEWIKLRLSKLDDSIVAHQRLWIRFYDVTGDPAQEARWWARLEENAGLTWRDIDRYSTVLEAAGFKKERRDVLEERVGTWLHERDRLKMERPPAKLLMDLFELRERDRDYDKALAIAEYLSTLTSAELGNLVTPPMVAYKKGKLLQTTGRYDEAQKSFEKAITMAPDSLWGKLSASAQKEMAAAQKAAARS